MLKFKLFKKENLILNLKIEELGKAIEKTKVEKPVKKLMKERLINLNNKKKRLKFKKSIN